MARTVQRQVQGGARIQLIEIRISALDEPRRYNDKSSAGSGPVLESGQAGLEFGLGQGRTAALLGQIPSRTQSYRGRIRSRPEPCAEQRQLKQDWPGSVAIHPGPVPARVITHA